MKYLLAFFLTTSFLSAADRGFVLERREQKTFIALVIGNAAYPDAPLANPGNDATDVAAALEGMGFVVERLPDADKEQMAEGIARFRAKMPTAKAAVFYFAGHGVQVAGENWLLPIGRTAATQISDETQVPTRAIAANEILSAMEQAKIPMNLVILDACRNNPFKSSGRGKVQGLAELRAPVGSLILYSTAAGKVATDGAGRNSPFTAALLKHLTTPGLDVRLLPSEITNTVGEMTGGVQVPWQSASLKSGFYFVPPMSDSEKFAAEKARKEEELRQGEMQAKLRDLATQMRAADEKKQKELQEETKRVEASLAASQKASADLSKQLESDLAAAREREQAEIAAARTKEDATLDAKKREIAELDAKIAAMKKTEPAGGAANADLDEMVNVMNQRKAKKAELLRLEQEAQTKREKAAADAAEKRRQEEFAAAERRKKAEAEAQAKQAVLHKEEQEKAAELARLKRAEQQALYDRLQKDLAKYRALATSDEGKDMAPAAWAKICATYKVGEVKEGDEGAMEMKIVPEIVLEKKRAAEAAKEAKEISTAAENAVKDGTRPVLTAFLAKYPRSLETEKIREILALLPIIPTWAKANGKDQYGIWVDLTVGEVTQRFRWIAPGTFMMGSSSKNDNERLQLADGSSNEREHRVTLSKGYYMADSECPQSLWKLILGTNPSKFNENPQNPVESISWNDCQEFIKEINRIVENGGFRLPTEAEWEYACRSETKTPLFFGETMRITLKQVNCDVTSRPYENHAGLRNRERTMQVKGLAPNKWGLYEMHGNVREWCSDIFGEYPTDGVIDPTGPITGGQHIFRGGSWADDPRYCRSACRFADKIDVKSDTLGFRFVSQVSP